MHRILTVAAVVGGLTACTPAQVNQDVGYVISGTTIVKMACDEAMPLANMAAGVANVGPFIAAGVEAVCVTDAAIAKAAADPSTAQWLGQQIAMMRSALQAMGIKTPA